MLPLYQPAVFLDPVPDHKESSPGSGFHQRVQHSGSVLRARTVVKSQRTGVVVRLIIGFIPAFFGHQVPDLRIKEGHVHEGAVILVQRFRRIMQHQGHAVQRKVRPGQRFPAAEALQGIRVGFLFGPVIRQALPHPVSQRLPGIVRILEQVCQTHRIPGFHIIGPGSEFLGSQFLMIGGPCLYQEAHPVQAGPAVADLHVQPAVFLSVVAGLGQFRSQFLRPGFRDAVDFLRHRGMRCFRVPQFNL